MIAQRTLVALGLLSLLPTLTVITLAVPPVAVPEPMIVRVAVSDAIMVGQVTKIEDKPVKIRSGPDLIEMPVVECKVVQGIFGVEGQTLVRVASNRMVLGQQALLFLRRSQGDSFFVGAPVFHLVDKNSPSFPTDVKDALTYAKLLATADKNLQSENANNRYLTAALLIHRYRTPYEGKVKQEPIQANQSQHILQALSAADWKALTPGLERIHPRALFDMLGQTEQDGWSPPTTDKYQAAAERWTKENVKTYRIKRFVLEK